MSIQERPRNNAGYLCSLADIAFASSVTRRSPGHRHFPGVSCVSSVPQRSPQSPYDRPYAKMVASPSPWHTYCDLFLRIRGFQLEQIMFQCFRRDRVLLYSFCP